MAPSLFVILFLRRVVTQWLDRRRINDYLVAQGAQLQDLDLALFGPGWFGAQGDRIYTIRFRDREGNLQERSCRTSLFDSVYLSEQVEGPVRLELSTKRPRK